MDVPLPAVERARKSEARRELHKLQQMQDLLLK